jgi:DNA-binding transcriptional regulator YiaG
LSLETVSPKWKVKKWFISLTFDKLKKKMSEKEREKLEEKSKAVLQKIVERRKELGLSQSGLAIKINMSFSGYFKVETGKTKLDTFRLLLILDTLEISPKEFFKDFK